MGGEKSRIKEIAGNKKDERRYSEPKEITSILIFSCCIVCVWSGKYTHAYDDTSLTSVSVQEDVWFSYLMNQNGCCCI